MKQRFRLRPKPTETRAAVNTRLAASVVSRLLDRGHRDLATAVAAERAWDRALPQSDDELEELWRNASASVSKLANRNTVDLKKEYDRWNRKLFGGKLPNIPLHWSRSKRRFGEAVIVGFPPHGQWAESLSISDFYEQTYPQFLGTLIHEMIHVKLAQQQISEKPHGKNFEAERRRLSALVPFKILGTEKTETPPVSQQIIIKPVGVVVYRATNKITIFDKNVMPAVMSRMESMPENWRAQYSPIEFYLVKNRDLARYPVTRKLSGAISVHTVKDELLSAILKSKKLGTVAKVLTAEARGRGHRDLATAVAVRVAAGLAQDLTAKMEALLRDFSVAESKKLGEWFAQTFGRVTQSSTPRGGKDVKKVAEAMLWELRNRASQSKDLEAARKQVEHVWRNQMLPLVPQLIKLFSEEGGIDVPIESRIADRVYENRAGLTGPKLRAFTTKLEGLWNSLKGWRRHALKGELRVVLAGPRDFRGTAAGTYKSQQDTLFVRATPAVMKRQAGTYASPDYILVHELGHRYEYRVGRLPTDFDQSGWATTPYSHKEGERFAELFALGHFGLQNWGSTRFDDVVDRFESVMSGRQQAVGAGPTSPPMPFKLGDEVLYGKYKNHRGRIIQFGRNPKGQITVQIEPIPKGRKKTKEMGLFKIWTTPDAIEGVTK